MAQKKNLKQKLAVAMSVVNALNVGATMVLPYVHVAQNIRAEGGHAEGLADALTRSLYGTAYATSQFVPAGNDQTFSVEPMTDGDEQEIGGTGTVTTMNGGKQVILSGGTGKITTMNDGGLQIFSENDATGTVTTMNGGTQELSGLGATGTIDTMYGGTQIVSSGTNIKGTITTMNGGTQIVYGGTPNVTNFNTGGVIVLSGATITNENTPITNWRGGTLRIEAGACYKKQTDFNNGVIEIKNGGILAHQTSAVDVKIGSKGVVAVYDGGTVFLDNVHDASGVLEIHSGAKMMSNGEQKKAEDYALQGGTLRLVDGATVGETTDEIMTVNNGTLEIGSGGTAIGTVVQAGGTQHVLPNGNATKTDLEGGTVSVEDDATVQIAKANGGMLELRDTGLAEAVFGGLEAETFNIDTLKATGDSVKLGIGGKDGAAASAVGKTLNIGTLNGTAKFYVNTDLASNKSDKINITNSTKAQSTILVNYDATVAATGKAPAGAKALVATVADNNATFAGGETTVGGYKFTPTLLQEGTNWYITGAENDGPSEQMYASVDTATWQAIAWRDSNFVIGSRMAQLHHNPESAHQNDFWVDFTRGRNRTNNFGHAMNRTYDRVSVGYDRLVGHGWTVGLAYGYEKGTEGYEKGSGDSTGNVVTAYATWQGAHGNYVDMTIKGGQLESDFTVQDDNQVTPSKADTRATGAGVSAVYGHRFENASAFYVEPHAGFYWSHLGGYDYRLSDGSDVSVDGCNSFVGNLGVNVGKRLGKGEVYARADFMHDFSGNVRVSMTKAELNNTMENPLHDSWLNVAVGYRQNYDRVGWYAEAGCQSIGSRESSGDWVWKAGVEFKF